LPEILDGDKITAATIELNSIVLGTHDGYVHVLSFTGELVKSIKAHDRPVNAISVDGSGHTIAR
jgi:WD40 repeat protein